MRVLYLFFVLFLVVVADLVMSFKHIYILYIYIYIERESEKEMATNSSILPRKIPWLEEPGRLHSMELQRVGHD